MAQFSIPNQEQFLPVLPGAQPLSFSTPAAADPAFDRVQQLISMLETARPPEPQKLKTWQKIVGGLGDAIQAMAAVRAGGAPPALGPFAAQQLSQRQRFEQESRAAEIGNVASRNEIVKLFIGEQLQREREEATARIRSRPRAFQLKQLKTTDKAGRPIIVPYNYDPNSATLAPVPGFELGFEQYVRPFLAQGLNQETGELEFRLVDPFQQIGGGGAPQVSGTTETVGAGGATRDKLGGQGLEGFGPKPTAAEAEAAETVSVIQSFMSEFKDRASRMVERFRNLPRSLEGLRVAGQEIVRKAPGGRIASEALGDPDVEALASLRTRLIRYLARLAENNRLSDQDVAFADENLPSVASLTTEAGRSAAAQKIEIVESEIAKRLERKNRLRPGFVGGGTSEKSDDEAFLERIRKAIESRSQP